MSNYYMAPKMYFALTLRISFILQGMSTIILNNTIYYTLEEFFIYKTIVEKWTNHHVTPQNDLLTGL